MIRPVPQIACDFVAQHEACRLEAYRDVGGVWTIGYGHTLGVTKGATCSVALAKLWLQDDLATAAKRLAGVVDEAVLLKLTDHQYAALVSFAFNCGTPPKATLWKVLNAGQLERVPTELGRWICAGGKVIPGLVNRRAVEVALWNTPDDAKPVPVPPPSSAVTRDAVQPAPQPGLLSRLLGKFAA